MKQKIFLKKGSRLSRTPSTSGSSLFSFRNVFKFVVIILFWAAFIPLLWHQKTKNAEDKANSAKVVKEVPKSPTPAASGEISSAPPAASPVQPTVAVPAAVPAPPAAKVEPAKVEPAKVTAIEPPQTNEPVAGRTENQAKPPIMPVPEAKPAAPSVGSTSVAQGVSGVVSGHKPGEVVQGVAAAKPATGSGTAPAGSMKLGDKITAGAKSKPGAASISPDKTRPVAGSGASSEVSTAKPTEPGVVQPKITKQKAPVMMARAKGQPLAAAAPTKPAAPSAPAAAPPTTPPSPPADKPKESLQEANWVYIVHLGSFQNPSQAQDLQKRLQKKGYAAVVKSQLNLQKGKIYNVELTSVQDAAEARTKMNKLQAEEQLNPVLLKVMGKH